MPAINSLGYVTATTGGVPLSPTSIPCDKLLIQALPTVMPAGAPTNASTQLIFVGKANMNRTTGAGVIYVIAPGGSLVIGDETEDDPLDAGRDIYVSSPDGTGVITGLAYQR